MDRAAAAREMRRAGRSRSQIAEALGLASGGQALSRWLKDVAPPEWTRRPNAKDDLRTLAVEMRQTGLSYRQIAENLPERVSKSTLSLWLRDVPLSETAQDQLRLRRTASSQQRSNSIRAQRIRRQETAITQARHQIEGLAESELFAAGLAAYWAEGCKAKPWRSGGESLTFINSDPDMIRLFLAWLRLLGVGSDRLILRLSIHERADLQEAHRYWAELTGVSPSEFRKPSLKRHNPTTIRHNTGQRYRGCLVIYVRRSTDLYRQVAGWWAGLTDHL